MIFLLYLPALIFLLLFYFRLAVRFKIITKRLFNEFIKLNAKKFIFISSVKATTDQVKSILKENSLQAISEDKSGYLSAREGILKTAGLLRMAEFEPDLLFNAKNRN